MYTYMYIHVTIVIKEDMNWEEEEKRRQELMNMWYSCVKLRKTIKL